MENNHPNLEFFDQVFAGAWITQAISVASELCISDLLMDGPRTLGELAEKTHARRDSLYRLLRALASVGIFAQDADGRFSLTPLAEMLRSDVPQSQRAKAVMLGGEFHSTWGNLLYSVKTGKQGFQAKFGESFFQYMQGHPDRHQIYDAAMETIHGIETGPMLDAYDFSGVRSVVDIGGGSGQLLDAVLTRYPDLQGTLFDLPAVAERARARISRSGWGSRYRIVGGDFFSSIPPGADVYLMRHVLHDWEDQEAIAILERCREAMGPESMILVIETVIPPGNTPCSGKWLDLMMLLVGGRERTEQEYGSLLWDGGFRVNRIIPTRTDVSIIEGVKRS
jgi:hypothetical protein